MVETVEFVRGVSSFWVPSSLWLATGLRAQLEDEARKLVRWVDAKVLFTGSTHARDTYNRGRSQNVLDGKTRLC